MCEFTLGVLFSKWCPLQKADGQKCVCILKIMLKSLEYVGHQTKARGAGGQKRNKDSLNFIQKM